MFRRVAVFVPPFFALAGVSFASTIRDDKAQSLYTALGNSFTSVGAVGVDGHAGSGTLISSQWVLTAAHVVNDGTNNYTNPFFLINGQKYVADQAIAYTGWTAGFNDVALLHLEKPVAGITPSVLWGGTNNSVVGKVATSVGFGLYGNGLVGDTLGGYGTKRGFTNVIDGYNLDPVNLPGFTSDFDNPQGTSNSLSSFGSSATATDLEGCVAPGDSGGGLFETIGKYSNVLVGVTDYVWWTSGNRSSNIYGYYGDGSGYISVSDEASWIFQKSGVGAVPEPGSFVVVGMGLLLLVRRRR